MSQNPTIPPVTPTDPIEMPPPKRSGGIRPELSVVNKILYVHPYEGEEILIEIIEDGKIIWSDISFSNTFILPDLIEGNQYVVAITYCGKSWYDMLIYSGI